MEQFVDETSECTPDGRRWPRPTQILMKPGDAAIAMYHIPHGDANAALLPIVMESLVDFYAPNAERLAQGLNMPSNGKSGLELMYEVIAKIRHLQQQIGCTTDFKRWNVSAQDMEQIIMAVCSDPVAVMYPLGSEKIQEIALKVIG